MMPDGILSPQEAYTEWQKNPYLLRLSPEDFTIKEIQELADEGFIILGAYASKGYKSHLMFVGHSELQFSTVLNGTFVSDRVNSLPTWATT